MAEDKTDEQEKQDFIKKYVDKGKNLKVGECLDIVEENGSKIKVCKVNADPNGFEVYGQIA